jgi:hypothetical protein
VAVLAVVREYSLALLREDLSDDIERPVWLPEHNRAVELLLVRLAQVFYNQLGNHGTQNNIQASENGDTLQTTPRALAHELSGLPQGAELARIVAAVVGRVHTPDAIIELLTYVRNQVDSPDAAVGIAPHSVLGMYVRRAFLAFSRAGFSRLARLVTACEQYATEYHPLS